MGFYARHRHATYAAVFDKHAKNTCGRHMNKRIDNLQILRAIAAMAVVVHHTFEEALYTHQTTGMPDWLITSGAAGVDIFFVISGFIMVYVSFPKGQEPVTPRRFLLDRTTRIYPFYWVCTGVVICLWSIGFYKNLHLSLQSAAQAILLLPTNALPVPVAWTLILEIYFYAIFAIALLGKTKSKVIAITAGVIFCAVLISSLSGTSIGPYNNPITIEFCFGMFAALLFDRLSKVRPRHSYVIGGVALAAIIIAPIFVPHANTNGLPSPYRLLVWGIPSFLLLVPFLRQTTASSRLSRIGIALGDASYAIYLTHPFCMMAYAVTLRHSALVSDLPQLIVAPFVITASALLGIAAHRYLEAPITRLIRRHILPKRQKVFQLEEARQ